MEIKQFAQEVHENAKAHGWWDGQERSFGELIALCHSELSEALEEYRNGHKPDETYYSCKAPKTVTPEDWESIKHCPYYPNPCDNGCVGHYGKMEGIPSELADVVIRVFDMAEHYGIDIEAALKEKHEFNKTRPYKHGGKKI